MARSDDSRDWLYGRLEVGPGASQEEIARSYRRLAHHAHPDTHPDDPDAARRFREITEAYEVLGDPQRRAGYDRTRQPRPAAPSPPPPAAPPTPPAGQPVRLGTWPVSPSGTSLRIGPVRVEPGSSHAAEPLPGELSFDELVELLWRALRRGRWR